MIQKKSEPTDVTPGMMFVRALLTILFREQAAAGYKVSDWARAAGVDRRSLERLLQSQGRTDRAVSVSYAWKLSQALGMDFHALVSCAITLTFHTTNGRPQWKPVLLKARPTLSLQAVRAEKAGEFAERLGLALSETLRQSGISKAELARRTGRSRASLSRLGRPGYSNHGLDTLFEFSCAVSPLDLLIERAGGTEQLRTDHAAISHRGPTRAN